MVKIPQKRISYCSFQSKYIKLIIKLVGWKHCFQEIAHG
jgi:hypothetical protein